MYAYEATTFSMELMLTFNALGELSFISASLEYWKVDILMHVYNYLLLRGK